MSHKSNFFFWDFLYDKDLVKHHQFSVILTGLDGIWTDPWAR